MATAADTDILERLEVKTQDHAQTPVGRWSLHPEDYSLHKVGVS